MGITSPYPRENIIAGNYILADMQAYLNKRHRQQNKEILIRHSPVQIPAHLTTHSAKSRSVFPDITERVSASADQ